MMQRYAAPLPGAYLKTEVEGLTLLYHRRSGQTHILAEPAPHIIEALAAGEMTEAELLSALAASYEVSNEGAIGARLTELVAAGLVTAA